MFQNFGILDIPQPRGSKCPAFMVWKTMLQRCYSPAFHKRNISYINCVVDERWKKFSDFKGWFDTNYKKNTQLDKDLLAEGNLIYGPDTCLFVPCLVNNLFHEQGHIRGDYPKGVKFIARTGRFAASISKYGKDKHLGYFDTPIEAEAVYKEAKRAYVMEVAATVDCEKTRQAMVKKVT